MSLRARLVLGLLALAAVGLLVLDFVSYAALRSYLSDRVDQQVEAAIGPATFVVGRRMLVRRAPGENGAFETLRVPKPFRPPEGRPPFDRELHAGGPPSGPQLPPGTYAARLNARGDVVRRRPFSYGETGLPKPELPAKPPITRSSEAPKLFTVSATDGSSPDFRAMAIREPGGSGSIAVAVPLRDLTQTLDHLRTIELVVTGAVLLALAAMAWWVIRLGLRPLERMEQTAEAIAAGDLSARVESTDQRTEVGRLGSALNRMLGQIERAFAERQASEDRLRRFLADASHELRTPLSSIRGYAEIFRTGAAREPEQLANAMQRIEDEAARMGGLVDDLLALARLDEVRERVWERIDLGALAGEACRNAAATAPNRTIGLEVESPMKVLGDRDQLHRVVINLLQNAIAYTPAGSPIEVSVAGDDTWATLTVRDHGPGLEPGTETQVFDRFWRHGESRHPDESGTGLGLAIVAAIVNGHGGNVEAQNADGEGAQFTVVLPAVERSAARQSVTD